MQNLGTGQTLPPLFGNARILKRLVQLRFAYINFLGEYGASCFHICNIVFTGEGGPAGYWGDSVSGVTAAAAHHPHMANHKDWAWF